MRMAVWERGAGQTLACGTGACATVVAGVVEGRIERHCRHVNPHLSGGPGDGIFASNAQFDASATQWPWSPVRNLTSWAATAEHKVANLTLLHAIRTVFFLWKKILSQNRVHCTGAQGKCCMQGGSPRRPAAR